MRVTRQLLLLYFLYIATFVVVAKVFGSDTVSLLKYAGLWISPLVFIILGLLIGLIVVLAIDNPKKKSKIFKACSTLAFIGFTIIVFNVRFSDWKHQRDFGNIESNKDYLAYLVIGYEAEVHIAFDTLSKIMGNPNSFKLTGHHVQENDTLLNGIITKSYLVQLRYMRNNDQKKYKALVMFLNDRAQLVAYNKLLDKADRIQIDSVNQIGEKGLRDLKKLPDSVKDRLGDDFKEMIDR